MGIHIYMSLSVAFACTIQLFKAQSVQVSLSTTPIIFGEEVTLECKYNISSKNIISRIWSRVESASYSSICQDVTCENNLIFSASIGNDSMSYKLVIYKFGTSDINKRYKCLLNLTDNLTQEDGVYIGMNPEQVIYVPTEDDIASYVDVEYGIIDLTFVLNKVFPTPACMIQFGKTNITEHLITTIWSNAIFNSAYLRLHKVSIENKNAMLIVTCEIGSVKRVMIRETFRKDAALSDVTSTAPTTNSIILISFGILFMIIGIFLLIFNWKKRPTCSQRPFCQIPERDHADGVVYLQSSRKDDRAARKKSQERIYSNFPVVKFREIQSDETALTFNAGFPLDIENEHNENVIENSTHI